MRVFPICSSSAPPKTSRRCWLAAMVMASLLLNACAVQKRYGFTARSVTKISYDPNRCVELTDGTYKCKDVVFMVSLIQPVTVK